MAFQPLTEFPTFLQFTPDPYVIPTLLSSDSTQSSGFWHCSSDTQPDVHMNTSMNYCIAKLSAQSLIICFQEDYRAAPSHAAPLCSLWPRNAAANTRARHLDGADAAPVGRVNNLVNPASNCKSLRSQMAFWRIFFFFFTFLMHCFPNSSAQQMYRKYWQNSIWTLMYLWDWLSPNTE